MKRSGLLRMVTLSMFVAIGVVISPILRVEGLCPTAHLVNIVAAVFMGPWYALLNAFMIGIIRMTLMSIPPLALTGAVFGAFLSGVFYRLSKGNILAAVAGEVVGTGLIGSIVSYPVMSMLYGKTDITWMFYVPSFLLATLMGGSVAYLFLNALRANGTLYKIQKELGVHSYERSKSLMRWKTSHEGK
ncbi:MAG: energy coupling factor transporter S component ThiW [Peptostreptococcaceae bacterium]|nr:energy coupling factor transporter S component ThiW [Peptostreptococcaceae bacterium]